MTRYDALLSWLDKWLMLRWMKAPRPIGLLIHPIWRYIHVKWKNSNGYWEQMKETRYRLRD